MKKEDGYLDLGVPASEVSAHARGVDPWPGQPSCLATSR